MNRNEARIFIITLFLLLNLIGIYQFSSENVFASSMAVTLSNATASFIGDGNGSGQALAIVGDVNGDGYEDFLIGAPYNNEAAENAGKTYLIFGKETGWEQNYTLANADASFLGEYKDDYSGKSVTGVGDVNGDEFDDFLISAIGYTGTNRLLGKGKVYLILGKSNGWIKNMPLSQANASFIGSDYGDHAGISIAGLGNINGDKYDDFIIGGVGQNNNGTACIIFGKPNGWKVNTNLYTAANASYIGEKSFDFAGGTAEGVGDVNGDGYNDILIGAHGNDDGGECAGQTYLIFGKRSGWALNITISNADASFIGEKESDFSSTDIAGIGDVNFDGYDDFLIRAMDKDTDINKIYLIFGRESGWQLRTDLSIINTSFIGKDLTGIPKGILSKIGDVNGDNFDDILVCGRHEVYLIYGKNLGWKNNIDLLESNIIISDEDVRFYTIGGSGDVNNDGHNDLLISRPWKDTKDKERGKTYLFLNVNPLGFKILPQKDNLTAIEDQFYNQKYSCIGASEELVAWTYESNASWLNWESSLHTIWGTPTNNDVGQYWVRINISYNNEFYDEHNFTLTVVNVNDPPEIIGAPLELEIPAYEDYVIDFSNYLIDVDNTTEELRVGVGSKYVVVNGLNITFNYPNSVAYEKVYIVATDGIDYANTHVLNNTVIAKELPVILNKTPIGENVPISSNISITFSNPMNKTSVEAAFALQPNLAGKFSWHADNTIMIFTPQAELALAQEYTVNISSSAKNQNGSPLDGNMNELIDGAPLDDYSWKFRTVTTPNQRPIIKIESPENNSVYNVNDTIYFDCINSIDPDGDILEFMWHSNISGILSNEPKFELNLPVGHHLITLFVNDNHNHNVSTTLNIIVIPYNRPPIPIIDSPKKNDVFNTTDIITFDGASSYDPDNDILEFFWQSNISGGFGYSLKLDTKLPAGRHQITLFVNDKHYHNVSVSINITVLNESDGSIDGGPNDNIYNPPEPEKDKNIFSRFGTYSLIAIIITIIIIAGFVATTEIGKFGLMGLFVPLYSRLKGKKVLDHETRGMIRGYVMANPGDHYNNIKRTIGLQNGALTYHLRVLEREELIKSQRDGIYKRFYPVEMRVPENVMQLSKIQETILNEIIEQPGISERELGKKLEVSPRVINYHVKKLISANLIKHEKLGKKTKYYVLDDSKIII